MLATLHHGRIADSSGSEPDCQLEGGLQVGIVRPSNQTPTEAGPPVDKEKLQNWFSVAKLRCLRLTGRLSVMATVTQAPALAPAASQTQTSAYTTLCLTENGLKSLHIWTNGTMQPSAAGALIGRGAGGAVHCADWNHSCKGFLADQV